MQISLHTLSVIMLIWGLSCHHRRATFVQPPDCDPSHDCGTWVVYPYFISFVVLVSIIMLQLFTAVIIESFEAQEEQDVSAHKGGSAPLFSQLLLQHTFTTAALVYQSHHVQSQSLH
mgnify:CR=1 FL=1